MRKTILWLLMLILLCTGCGAPADVETSPVTYTVETETVERTVTAEDGTLLAKINNQLPVLRTENGDPAVTAVFNEAFDYWRQNNELEQAAREAYLYSPELFKDGTHYAEELTFSVWQTEKLISIRGNAYSYYGGAHPNTALLAWNFDLESGTYIRPLSLGEDAEDAHTLRTAVAEELTTQAAARAAQLQVEPTVMYWEDYRDILRDWDQYAVSFDAEGMTVSFSPYDLGPYAIGPQEFLVGYEFLKPYLSDYGKTLLELNG